MDSFSYDLFTTRLSTWGYKESSVLPSRPGLIGLGGTDHILGATVPCCGGLSCDCSVFGSIHGLQMSGVPLHHCDGQQPPPNVSPSWGPLFLCVFSLSFVCCHPPESTWLLHIVPQRDLISLHNFPRESYLLLLSYSAHICVHPFLDCIPFSLSNLYPSANNFLWVFCWVLKSGHVNLQTLFQDWSDHARLAIFPCILRNQHVNFYTRKNLRFWLELNL